MDKLEIGDEVEELDTGLLGTITDEGYTAHKLFWVEFGEYPSK